MKQKVGFRQFITFLFALLTVVSILNIPVIPAKAASPKLVAFTFDDGPYKTTGPLLDGLAARGAKATFFMVGQSGACGVAGKQEIINRMVREGHQVANHTWSHVAPFARLSASEMRSEIDSVYPYLKTAMGGDFKQLVRIPGGDMSRNTSATVAYPMIRFDFNPQDYIYMNVDKTYQAIISGVKDGSIVCLHDRIKESCDAALRAIDYLQARGYECVTISELFRRRGIDLEAYHTYNSAYNNGINLPAYKKPVLTKSVSKFGKVTISVSTPDKGITLRYTTDGSIPDLSSRAYQSPINVEGALHLRVAGFDKYGTRTEIAEYSVDGAPSEAVFNSDYYASVYPDMKQYFGSDSTKLFDHYMRCGLREGRAGSPTFNVTFYKKSYTDLNKAYGNDNARYLEHFINFGMKEGRQGSSIFDVYSYKNYHQDLRLAYGNNLPKYYEHYNKYGYAEGRVATGAKTVMNAVTKQGGMDYSLVYDYYYYTQRYPDVKRTYGNDDIAALRHFINFGMKEGRQGKASFDVWSYKNAHPDIRAAYGNDLKSYYIHYIKYGYRENRVCTNRPKVVGATTVYNGVDYKSVYSYYYYTNKYPDILKAYGNDDVAVLRHFVNFGMKEERQGSAEFNPKLYKSRYDDLRSAYGDNNSKYYYHYINAGKAEGRSGR
ncbi:MAG: polysaccharide deacetylase family protein [Eubacterium sp.]|nr:polysaccharide deacetylase family protein [Eubacterium sp.]